MEQSTTTADRPMPAVALMVIGGVVAAIGTFLKWFEVTSPGTTETTIWKGSEMNVGTAIIVFGALVAVSGILVAVRAARTGGKGWSITALVASIFVAIVGLFSAVAPESAMTSLFKSDVSEQAGISRELAEAALEQAFATGLINATSAIGTWIVFVGGLLGMIGAIMGIAFARKRRAGTTTATAAPPPPPPS